MIWKVIVFSFSFIFFSCGRQYSNEDLAIFKYNESAGIHTLDPAFAKDQAK